MLSDHLLGCCGPTEERDPEHREKSRQRRSYIWRRGLCLNAPGGSFLSQVLLMAPDHGVSSNNHRLVSANPTFDLNEESS